MTKDDGRRVSEGILVDVKVCTANPTEAHFDFDLIIATRGLFYLSQLNITNAAFVFDESFQIIFLRIERCSEFKLQLAALVDGNLKVEL